LTVFAVRLEGITPESLPYFPPAGSAGKCFSKEIPNKKICSRYPRPSFPGKTGQGDIWSDTP